MRTLTTPSIPQEAAMTCPQYLSLHHDRHQPPSACGRMRIVLSSQGPHLEDVPRVCQAPVGRVAGSVVPAAAKHEQRGKPSCRQAWPMAESGSPSSPYARSSAPKGTRWAGRGRRRPLAAARRRAKTARDIRTRARRCQRRSWPATYTCKPSSVSVHAQLARGRAGQNVPA